jgi:hypothetical protein
MLSFPVGKHDDLLDAAAFGTAFLLDVGEPRGCFEIELRSSVVKRRNRLCEQALGWIVT